MIENGFFSITLPSNNLFKPDAEYGKMKQKNQNISKLRSKLIVTIGGAG